jgi:integrase/recombinase XerD
MTARRETGVAGNRCLKVEAWPASHRDPWLASLRPGDPIDGDGGRRAAQRPITNRGVAVSYGRFLTYLAKAEMLDPHSNPADAITPDAVRGYVADLQHFGNKPGTVHVRLQHLREMGKVFDPGRDWSFIARAMARMHALRRGRDPFSQGRFVSSDELLDLGMRLMADPRTETARPHALVQYRDGLLIAFLAVVPLRLKNLAELSLGETLVRSGETWSVVFGGAATKTHRAMEFPWPEFLTPQLEQYVASVRVRLLDRRGRWYREPGQSLWISSDGSEMGQAAISDRITARSRAAFGFALRPHAFRHAAPTTIAIDDPANVRAAAPLLGHASYATTGRAYNVAKTIEAQRAFAASILSLKRR